MVLGVVLACRSSMAEILVTKVSDLYLISWRLSLTYVRIVLVSLA